jgi:hypothetical protein
LCGEPGCTSTHKAQGYCQRHYSAAARAGEIQLRPHNADVRERIKAYSTTDGGCIRWTGSHKSDGYGTHWHDGKSWLVHRLVWTIENGPIPDGMQVDHKCHVRDCINVDHLRLLTNRENSEHRSGPTKRNVSGHLGVTKRRTGYGASVNHDGKNIYLGTFRTAEQAAQAAADKRNELFTHNDKDRPTVAAIENALKESKHEDHGRGAGRASAGSRRLVVHL